MQQLVRYLRNAWEGSRDKGIMFLNLQDNRYATSRIFFQCSKQAGAMISDQQKAGVIERGAVTPI